MTKKPPYHGIMPVAAMAAFDAEQLAEKIRVSTLKCPLWFCEEGRAAWDKVSEADRRLREVIQLLHEAQDHGVFAATEEKTFD